RRRHAQTEVRHARSGACAARQRPQQQHGAGEVSQPRVTRSSFPRSPFPGRRGSLQARHSCEGRDRSKKAKCDPCLRRDDGKRAETRRKSKQPTSSFLRRQGPLQARHSCEGKSRSKKAKCDPCLRRDDGKEPKPPKVETTGFVIPAKAGAAPTPSFLRRQESHFNVKPQTSPRTSNDSEARRSVSVMPTMGSRKRISVRLSQCAVSSTPSMGHRHSVAAAPCSSACHRSVRNCAPGSFPPNSDTLLPRYGR